MKEECKDCKFFSKIQKDGNNLCLRYPPIILEYFENKSVFGYPTIYEWCWCGEFKSKDEKMAFGKKSLIEEWKNNFKK